MLMTMLRKELEVDALNHDQNDNIATGEILASISKPVEEGR